MGRSLRLGSWFGIAVYLHWTLFLVPLAFFTYFACAGELETAVVCGVTFPVLYACVLLHEFGHALTARHFGIGTQDITMFPIGGVARLERMSERPAEEFWIAIAGPLVNLAIAVFGCVAVGVFFGRDQLLDPDLASLSVANLLRGLCFANLMLVAFNLLPAFPMDGGRVLRALLSARFGLVTATEIAAGLGLVMSAVFVCLGLMSSVGLINGSPLLVFIGLFVGYVGQRELAAVRRTHRPRHRDTPLDVLPAGDVIAASPGPDFSGFTWDQSAGHWIQWHHGQPVHKICVEPD